jgi:hypothetical protein
MVPLADADASIKLSDTLLLVSSKIVLGNHESERLDMNLGCLVLSVADAISRSGCVRSFLRCNLKVL